MGTQVKHHPTSDQLIAFASGLLSDIETETVAEHVENCDTCAGVVEKVELDPESLFFGTSDTHISDGDTRRNSEAKPIEQEELDALADTDLQLEDVIGSGGMGVVYRAWQPGLNRYVAVKQLMLSLPKDEKYTANAAARFQREVRALGRVRHPHLVEVYSSGLNDEGRLFYSMQLLEGSDLAGVYRALAAGQEMDWQQAVTAASVSGRAPVPAKPHPRYHAGQSATGFASATDERVINSPGTGKAGGTRSESPLSGAFDIATSKDSIAREREQRRDYIRDIVTIIRQVASATQCLHEHGIVHRDIKPANIMVSAQGDHATLMDLGLAGLVEDPETRLTRSGQIAGSLPYISPEQFLGEEPSTSGDIYNLGAVLWEFVTRRRLFDAGQHASEAALINRIMHDEPADVATIVPGVSRDVAAIVRRCLEKRPDDRYASVKELVEDLDRFLAGQPVQARQQSIPSRVLWWARRNRKTITGLTFAATCVGMLVGGSMLTSYLSPAAPIGPVAPKPVVHNFIDDDSLVAFWPGEGDGDEVFDESPNEHHGRLIGNVERKPGAVGNAFYFDGKSHITFGRGDEWNFLHDGSPFSIAGFVQAEPNHATTGGGILSTVDDQSGISYDRQGMILRVHEPGLQLHIQGETYPFPALVRFAEELDANVFTAFAVTFDGVIVSVYIDGKLKATATASGPFVAKTSKDGLAMGAIGTTSGDDGEATDPLIGAIDELQVYNRALNEAEVLFLAQTNQTIPSDWNPATAKTLLEVTDSKALGAKAMQGTGISATHDGSGMTDPFPAYPAPHSANDADGFLTESSETVSLHYDLGSRRTVNQLRLWNYHGGEHNEDGNRCGAQRLDLLGSNDPTAFNDAEHSSWTYITTKVFSRATGRGATVAYGDKHNFDDVSYRFLRLQVHSNCGGPRTGIAEVQFVHVDR